MNKNKDVNLKELLEKQDELLSKEPQVNAQSSNDILLNVKEVLVKHLKKLSDSSDTYELFFMGGHPELTDCICKTAITLYQIETARLSDDQLMS